MKIIHVIEKFEQEYGGPYVSLRGIVEHSKNSHVVLHGSDLDKTQVRQCFNINPYNIKNFWRVLSDECCVERNTIIHLHSPWNLFFLVTLLFAYTKSINLVFSPRGSITKYSLKRHWFAKKVIISFLKIINMRKKIYCLCSSKLEKVEVEKEILFREVHIIPNIVDINTPINYNWCNRSRNILYFGRVTEKKGLHEFLTWMDAVNAKYNCKFHIDIYGPVEQIYFDKLKLKNATYKGIVDREDKFNVLSKYKIFALPSKTENYGNAIVEVLSCGLVPILTSNTPWQDLFTSKLALEFEQTSDKLKNAIEHLQTLTAHPYSNDLSNVITRLDPKLIGRQMDNFYQRILGNA